MSIVPIVLAGLFIIELAIGLWLWYTTQKLKNLFRGKTGKDLEEILGDIQKSVEYLNQEKDRHEKALMLLQKKVTTSIRGVGMIRFNPFKDSGSNQSFSTALVDENGNGIVLSSLYSRDRVSVFGKPLVGGKSEFDLTHEEKESIDIGLKKI